MRTEIRIPTGIVVLLIAFLAASLSACSSGGGGGGSGGDDGTAPPPAATGPGFFVNGADQANANSAWFCWLPANVGSDQYWTVAFYNDASGRYVGSTGESPISWAYTEPDMDFTVDGDTNQFGFRSVNRVSAQEFSADLTINGEVREQRSCQKFNSDGTRQRNGTGASSEKYVGPPADSLASALRRVAPEL